MSVSSHRPKHPLRHVVGRFAVSMLMTRQQKTWGLGFKLRRRRKFLSPEEFDKMVDALATSAKYTYRTCVKL